MERKATAYEWYQENSTLTKEQKEEAHRRRVVGRYENGPTLVSTIAVPFGAQKGFETFVRDSRYISKDSLDRKVNSGVVAAYDTYEEAKLGHERYVALFSSNPPPTEVTTVNNHFDLADDGSGTMEAMLKDLDARHPPHPLRLLASLTGERGDEDCLH
jgi:hypothetical protein